MAKAREQEPDPADTAFTSFSIRLDAKDTALLREAMDIKGWTAANFIRRATLERAVHVLNTSRATDLNFVEMARRVATQMCQPKVLVGDEDPRTPWEAAPDSLDGVPCFWKTANELEQDELVTFRDVARKGGTEFLAQVLAECERLRPSRRVPTINPDNI